MAADDDELLGPGLRALAHDRFVGVSRCARALGLAEKTIRKAIVDGQLPTYRFGLVNRLRVVDIRAWVASRRVR